jgi:hypothetical protein
VTAEGRGLGTGGQLMAHGGREFHTLLDVSDVRFLGDFVPVPLLIVFVDFALLFVSGFLVRTVAERLIL